MDASRKAEQWISLQSDWYNQRIFSAARNCSGLLRKSYQIIFCDPNFCNYITFMYHYVRDPWWSVLEYYSRSSTSLCVSKEATKWGSANENGKPEIPCHSRCGTIKIPPCSKALSAEHRSKFCSPSPAMVTSPYEWKKKLSQTQNSNKETNEQTNMHAFKYFAIAIFIRICPIR
jgi:hypothetical protein